MAEWDLEALVFQDLARARVQGQEGGRVGQALVWVAAVAPRHRELEPARVQGREGGRADQAQAWVAAVEPPRRELGSARVLVPG